MKEPRNAWMLEGTRTWFVRLFGAIYEDLLKYIHYANFARAAIWAACRLLQKNAPGVWIDPKVINIVTDQKKMVITCGNTARIEFDMNDNPRVYFVHNLDAFIRAGVGLTRCAPVEKITNMPFLPPAIVKIYENNLFINEMSACSLDKFKQIRNGKLEDSEDELVEHEPEKPRAFAWLRPLDASIFAERIVRMNIVYRGRDIGVRQYSDGSLPLTVDPSIFIAHARV